LTNASLESPHHTNVSKSVLHNLLLILLKIE